MAPFLLTIAIPIYNRKEYLYRSLERFLDDIPIINKEMIDIYISDNGSSDNLEEICRNYQNKGLNLRYHRNENNLGMDRNFVNCFYNAKGKYCWLLGSDDILVKGTLEKIVYILKQREVGLLNISGNGNGDVLYESNSLSFLLDINVWITFISGNVVNTKYIKDIDFDKYSGTYLSQLPLYLYAIFNSKVNCIYKSEYIEREEKKNGGYNLFEVFVKNYDKIISDYFSANNVSLKFKKKYDKIIFKKWLVWQIVHYLILKEKTENDFDFHGAWKLIWRRYKFHPYYYLFMLYVALRNIAQQYICIIKSMVMK